MMRCTVRRPPTSPRLFPPISRYAGASLGYQGASIIAGGPAPLISLWLYDTFKTGYAIGVYLAVLSPISLVAAFFLGRPTRDMTSAVAAAPAQPHHIRIDDGARCTARPNNIP